MKPVIAITWALIGAISINLIALYSVGADYQQAINFVLVYGILYIAVKK